MFHWEHTSCFTKMCFAIICLILISFIMIYFATLFLRHSLMSRTIKKVHRLWKFSSVTHGKPYLCNLYFSISVAIISFRVWLYTHVISLPFSLLISEQEIFNKMTFNATEGYQLWGKMLWNCRVREYNLFHLIKSICIFKR